MPGSTERKDESSTPRTVVESQRSRAGSSRPSSAVPAASGSSWSMSAVSGGGTGRFKSTRGSSIAAGVGLRRGSSTVILILGIGVVLWLGRGFLVPFAAAGLLAVSVTPPARWLEQRGCPHVVTTLLALFGTGVLALGVLALGYVGVVDIVDHASDYRIHALGAYENLQQLTAHTFGPAADAMFPPLETLTGVEQDMERESGDPSQNRSSGALAMRGLSLITATANSGLNILSGFFLMYVFFAFFLIQRDPLRAKVMHYMIDRGSPPEEAADILAHMGLRVNQYLWLKTAISVVTGLAFGLVAWLGGLPFALFWGFLGFALNFVPTIGPVIASIPPVLFAFVEFEMGYALILSTGLVGVQVLSGTVFEPQIMGDRLNMNVMAVLLCLFFWGIVWGPMGTLLAVPLTAMLQIVFEHNETTLPMAKLLAATPAQPLDPFDEP